MKEMPRFLPTTTMPRSRPTRMPMTISDSDLGIELDDRGDLGLPAEGLDLVLRHEVGAYLGIIRARRLAPEEDLAGGREGGA